MQLLLTTNWACLPPGSLEQSAVWQHAQGVSGEAPEASEASGRSLWALLLACTLGRAGAREGGAAAAAAREGDGGGGRADAADGSAHAVMQLSPQQRADLQLLAGGSSGHTHVGGVDL